MERSSRLAILLAAINTITLAIGYPTWYSLFLPPPGIGDWQQTKESSGPGPHVVETDHTA